MVTTDFMSNELRDTFNTNVTYLIVGKLKTTTPAITDFSAQHEILRLVEEATGNTTVDKFVTKEFVIDSTSGNGFSFNEVCQVVSDKTALEDGEAVADWTAAADAAISTEGTIKEFGTNSMKFALTFATGQGTGTKTTSIGNVSAITGVNSGTPTKGYACIDLYSDSLTNLNATDALIYRIGSGAGDYVEFKLQKTSLVVSTWYRWNMDLTTGTVTGTPDWTAMDYQKLFVNCTGNVNVYFDDMFLSKTVYSRSSVPTITKNSLVSVIYEIKTEFINQ